MDNSTHQQTEGSGMNLKSMSVHQLTSLRQQVETALNSKVIEQRRAIESKLAKLGSFQGGATRRGVGRGKVVPKYLNPDNDHETWTGRGMKPLWLAAAIKAGKKLDDFLIANANRSAKVKRRKAYSLPRRRDPLIAPVLGAQTVEAFQPQLLHAEVERDPIEPSNLSAAA
jgi:DNA-binding protein H-NS